MDAHSPDHLRSLADRLEAAPAEAPDVVEREEEMVRNQDHAVQVDRLEAALSDGRVETPEDKLALIKDFVDNPIDGALVRWAVQRQGFKSLEEMRLNLDLKEDSFEPEVREGFFQSMGGFMKRQIADFRKSLKNKAIGVGAGVAVGGLSALAIGAAPAAIPLLVGAAGGAIGSQIGKSVASYFARDRKMYRPTEGEPSLAHKAAAEIADNISQAHQMSKVLQEQIEEKGAALEPAEREKMVHETFNQIVQTLQNTAMENVQAFWKADKRAKTWEAGGALLGGVAGGFGANLAVDNLTNALHGTAQAHVDKAADHGISMLNGQVVPNGTPGAHVVQHLNIDHGVAYQVPPTAAHPSGEILNQSGWHYQVNHDDLSRAGLDFRGVLEHATARPEYINADLLAQGDKVFHILGGDPTGAIYQQALGEAFKQSLQVGALTGATVGMGDVLERLAAMKQSGGKGAEILQRLYDKRHGTSDAAGAMAGRSLSPEQEKVRQFEELLEQPGQVFKRTFLADGRVEMDEYVFAITKPDSGKVILKRLNPGGEANDAGEEVSTAELSEAFVKGELEKVGLNLKIADGKDFMANPADRNKAVDEDAEVKQKLYEERGFQQLGFARQFLQHIRREKKKELTGTAEEVKKEFQSWPAPGNEGFVIYTLNQDPVLVGQTIQSIWNHQKGVGSTPAGEMKVVVAVPEDVLKNTKERKVIEDEYAAEFAKHTSNPDWKNPTKVLLVPAGNEWKRYVHDFSVGSSLFTSKNSPETQFIDMEEGWGRKITGVEATIAHQGPAAGAENEEESNEEHENEIDPEGLAAKLYTDRLIQVIKDGSKWTDSEKKDHPAKLNDVLNDLRFFARDRQKKGVSNWLEPDMASTADSTYSAERRIELIDGMYKAVLDWYQHESSRGGQKVAGSLSRAEQCISILDGLKSDLQRMRQEEIEEERQKGNQNNNTGP